MARTSAASRRRQPLLRQKLNSHFKRTSSAPLKSKRVWIRLARSMVTPAICPPSRRKQWENWTGSSSAELASLRALTCTAPFSNVICERWTGTRLRAAPASAKASDSSNAGSEPIRRSNSGGLIGLDSFRGEKPAMFGLGNS